MADKKISELPSIAGASVDDANDTIAIVDSSAGQTKKITRAELFKDVDGAEFTGAVSIEANNFDPLLTFERSGTTVDFKLSTTPYLEIDIDGTPAARIAEAGATADIDRVIMTREKGDARYAQLDGDTFTGNLGIKAPNSTTNRFFQIKNSDNSVFTNFYTDFVGNRQILGVSDTSGGNTEFYNFPSALGDFSSPKRVLRLEDGDARYMQDGAYGLGRTGNGLDLPDLDATNTPSGHYRVINTTPNISSKPSGFGSYGYLNVYRYDNIRTKQVYTENTNGKTAVRVSTAANTWSDWIAVFPERGSNANGEYVRFPDGTQICTRNVSLGTRSSTSSAGGFYRSDTLSFGLPATFVGDVSGGFLPEGLFGNGFTYAAACTSTQWSVQAARPTSWTSLALSNVDLIAIGRWF